jgi:dTDP-4-dehydrorhamnose reductase
MRILITGGNGYLAKSLHSALCKKYDITLVTKNDLNLTYRHKETVFFKQPL